MLRFLTRRTFGAVVILLIIAAVTFFLFFAVPRRPGAARVRQGLHRPSCSSRRGTTSGWTSRCSRSSVLAVRHLRRPRLPGPGALPRALPRLLLRQPGSRCWRRSSTGSRSPSRSPSARAVIFLHLRRRHRHASRRCGGARPSTRSPASSSLIGASVQIYFVGTLALYFLVYQNHILRPTQVRAVHREPDRLVQRAAAALDRAGAHLHRQLHPYDPLDDGGAARRGLRPHRPGQGHVGAVRRSAIRLARHPDPHRHHLRHRPRGR